MARGGRRQAAGLSGDRWLGWLEAHDSTGFSWTKRGQMLLQAPYMPPTWTVKRKEVARLIVAARRWVDAVSPTDRKPMFRWPGKLTVPGMDRPVFRRLGRITAPGMKWRGRHSHV